MEKKFIAAFGTADAVITGVHAGLTVWRAVFTQLSRRICIGAGWTLHYTRAILVQEISCDTGNVMQNCLRSTTEESKHIRYHKIPLKQEEQSSACGPKHVLQDASQAWHSLYLPGSKTINRVTVSHSITDKTSHFTCYRGKYHILFKMRAVLRIFCFTHLHH